MKFACALLVLSVVFAAPQKRILLDSFLNTDQLKSLVGELVHTAGTKETEMACEDTCKKSIIATHVLQFACPLVCHSLESLAHRFDIVTSTPVVPSTATPVVQ